MAIHIEQTTDLQKGHQKTINQSGIMMIFDTLQKYQYSFPIKSTVRELLCNGMDSIAERNAAIEILTGKAKVGDYYADIEGDLYRDSKFDPSYYELDNLSRNNIVTMRYIVGPALEKDRVVFIDHGVGLGGKRLEGYFELAFSSKRLSKLQVGKFGLGAKAPLSIGIPFYTMESRYNGKLFRFNIYNSKVDSVIPKFNMLTGKENGMILFAAGTADEYPVYYEETRELNGVTITLEAKKHHKAQYIDAVRSQMLYFGNIQLETLEDGKTEKLDYQAKILYEDSMIVISDNNYFSKPHMLLNGVNYGYIAWDELELEEKNGNIGIKVALEDVEVNPSRESVLWTELTKEKVLSRFNEVVDIAAGIIQKELQSTDFLQWLKTCYSVWNTYSSRAGVIGILSKIVDLSRAKFKFLPDPRIIFEPTDPLGGIFLREVEIIEEREANKTRKRKVIRGEFKSMGSRWEKQIYLMSPGERASNRKDKWLIQQHGKPFITAMEPYGTIQQAEEDNATEEEIKRMNKYPVTERRLRWEALVASEGLFRYDEVVVPEEFTGNDQDVEEEAAPEATVEEKVAQAAYAKVAKQTAAERRKLTGKTLVYTTYSGHTDKVKGNFPGLELTRIYPWFKLEMPIAEINNWAAKEVYYGTEADSELIQFVAMITRNPAPGNKPGSGIRGHAGDSEVWKGMKYWRKNKDSIDKYKTDGANDIYASDAYQLQHFFDTDVMLFKTSQANTKYFRDFSRIEEFFFTIENKTVTMSNTLINWNTARIIMNALPKCAFLYNFPLNREFGYMYDDLVNYVAKHYREVKEHLDKQFYGLSPETYNDMLSHLDSVYRFQQFVASRPDDKDGISKLAGELFGNNEVRDGMAVDPQMIAQLDEVMEFAVACGSLFNHIPLLTGYKDSAPAFYEIGASRAARGIPEDLEHEVRLILEAKGILEYKSKRQLAEQQMPGPAEVIAALAPFEGEIFEPFHTGAELQEAQEEINSMK